MLSFRTHEITSPNYPRTYSNSDLVCYKIMTDNSRKIVLDFLSFSSEPKHDPLEVFDGPDDNARKLTTWSGHAVPPPLISTNNAMFITFRTDGSTAYSGFRILYKTVYDKG